MHDRIARQSQSKIGAAAYRHVGEVHGNVYHASFLLRRFALRGYSGRKNHQSVSGTKHAHSNVLRGPELLKRASGPIGDPRTRDGNIDLHIQVPRLVVAGVDCDLAPSLGEHLPFDHDWQRIPRGDLHAAHGAREAKALHLDPRAATEPSSQTLGGEIVHPNQPLRLERHLRAGIAEVLPERGHLEATFLQRESPLRDGAPSFVSDLYLSVRVDRSVQLADDILDERRDDGSAKVPSTKADASGPSIDRRRSEHWPRHANGCARFGAPTGLLDAHRSVEGVRVDVHASGGSVSDA